MRKLTFILLLAVAHCVACKAQNTLPVVRFAGCTPGDQEVKQMLAIPEEKLVDFIRWQLDLLDEERFSLSLSYGESRPNTLALKADSVHQTLIGTYQIEKTAVEGGFRKLYRLQSPKEGIDITVAQVTENLMHVLTGNKKLMVGNGGWSYQLNRQAPVISHEWFIRSSLVDDTSRRMVFDGRTPCKEISSEHPEMNTSDACFKLKWQLILERDPVTKQPSMYTIRKVIDGKAQHITGPWAMQKGTGALEGMIVYTIDPNNPETAMSFLVGDDNILIFLDKQMRPYLGNAHFSVALNRRRDL